MASVVEEVTFAAGFVVVSESEEDSESDLDAAEVKVTSPSAPSRRLRASTGATKPRRQHGAHLAEVTVFRIIAVEGPRPILKKKKAPASPVARTRRTHRRSVSFDDESISEEQIIEFVDRDRKGRCWYTAEDIYTFVLSEKQRRKILGIEGASCITPHAVATEEPPHVLDASFFGPTDFPETRALFPAMFAFFETNDLDHTGSNVSNVDDDDDDDADDDDGDDDDDDDAPLE